MCLVWSHHMRTSAVLSRSPTTSLTYESNNPLQCRRAFRKKKKNSLRQHLGGSTVKRQISTSRGFVRKACTDIRNTLARTTPLGVLRDWNKRRQIQVYGDRLLVSSWLIARSPPHISHISAPGNSDRDIKLIYIYIKINKNTSIFTCLCYRLSQIPSLARGHRPYYAHAQLVI